MVGRRPVKCGLIDGRRLWAHKGREHRRWMGQFNHFWGRIDNSDMDWNSAANPKEVANPRRLAEL